MSTGHHAAVTARVKRGDTVAVVGDGAVGLSAVLACKRLGAERIIALSRHADRQRLARTFGATDVIESRGDEAIAAVLELTDGVGVDAALECVGTQQSIDTTGAIARPGSTIGMVGVPHGEVPFNDTFFRNVAWAGGPAPSRLYIPERCTIFFTSPEVPPGTNPDDLEYWGTTVAGNALSKARIGRPMSRQKAAELLDGLIARAAAVNTDGDSLFTVERIELFGSFTDPGRQEVGDVDVRLLFDRRVDGDEFIRQALTAAGDAEENGRRFNNHVDRLGFVEREFQRVLRGRSPRLDIQFDAVGHESRLPDGVVTQVVYNRLPETEHHVPASTG